MYSWTLLSADVNTTPYLLGVTDDLAKAKRLTEPHLISGQAFLCLIETVRAAFTVHGMDSCYVRPGPDWLGRLTTSGQVRWNEEGTAALGVSWGRRAAAPTQTPDGIAGCRLGLGLPATI